MKRFVLLALPLAACAGAPPVNLCKYAEVRRIVYTSAIDAADAWAASGRPMPSEMVLGREAAVTALSILNRQCPPDNRVQPR